MWVGLKSAQVAHEKVLVGWLVGCMWVEFAALSFMFVSFLVRCFCSAKPAVVVKTSGVVLQDSPTHPLDLFVAVVLA